MSTHTLEPYQPAFIERNRRLQRAIRRWQLAAAGCFCVAVFSLLVVAGAIRAIPVIAFDSKGQPLLFDDTTTSRNRLDDLRIENFVERYVRRKIGVNSGNVDEDVAELLNMMGAKMQKLTIQDGTELKKREQYRFENLKSNFSDISIKIGPYSPDDMDEKIRVTAWGHVDFTNKLGDIEGSQKVISKYFLQAVVLERAPLSRNNIHGLLVNNSRDYYFQSKQDMETEIRRQQQ